MGVLKRLWSAAPIATIVLAVALAAFGFFATRAVLFTFYWHDPVHREQAIAGWMTPGYIAHSWHVPREVVLDALHLPDPPPKGPVNLTQLAALTGVSVDDLIGEAEAAIAAFRAQHPPPPAPPAPPEPPASDEPTQ